MKKAASTNTAIRIRKAPARPIPALLLLAQPGAHLCIVNEEAYILKGQEHKHINASTLAALHELAWIEEARTIDKIFASCAITEQGRRIAAEIEESKGAFIQLRMNLQPQTFIEQTIETQEQESQAIDTLTPVIPTSTETQERDQKQTRKSKEEAKAERTEKRVKMQKDMQQAVSSLLESIKAGKSERLLQYLTFAARFHHYSPLNQLMIAMQCPHATRVAGYTTWKRNGQQVKKGEKGIAILAPRPFNKVSKKNEETGEEETIGYQGITFRVAYVFDVSQLEENIEKPIPTFFTTLAGDHEALYTRIAQAVRAEGITLEIGPTGTAQGYSAGGRIRLREGMDSTNRCFTLIHEYAHEKLHHNPAGSALSAGKKECHAESISYIVAHHFGIENPYSSDYLQQWGTTEKELLTELETIKTTASEIIEAIEAQDQVSTETSQAAPLYPACHYCGQPAAENAQTLNDVVVCASCIDQETAMLHAEDIEASTDPEPPTPTGGSMIEAQEQERQTPKATTPVIIPSSEIQEEPEQKTEITTPTVTKKPQQVGREKQGSHKICLQWSSNGYYVSSEGQQKIVELLSIYKVCQRCETYFTQENPNVAGNICLDCVSKRCSWLTYMGLGEPDEDGTARHCFVDPNGMVCVSYPGSSYAEEPKEQYQETLRYWNFPVPGKIHKNGRDCTVKGAYWSIIGDVHHDVVLVHAWDTYPDKVEGFFLASKSGKLTQIDKRKASHRQLFVEARKRLQRGKPRPYTNDEYDEMRMIAQMLSEDVTLWP